MHISARTASLASWLWIILILLVLFSSVDLFLYYGHLLFVSANRMKCARRHIALFHWLSQFWLASLWLLLFLLFFRCSSWPKWPSAKHHQWEPSIRGCSWLSAVSNLTHAPPSALESSKDSKKRVVLDTAEMQTPVKSSSKASGTATVVAQLFSEAPGERV